MVDLLTKRSDQLDKLKKSLEKREKDLAKEKKTAEDAVTASKAATADIARRQNEAKNLRSAFEEMSLKNIGLVKDFNNLRDRAVDAELKAQSSQERVKQLEEQVKDQARELAQVKANFATGGGVASTDKGLPRDAGVTRPRTSPMGKLNPPAENIEGRVNRVDKDYVGISLGTDSGLQRGNTMMVFRLSEGGKYIGQVRIVDAQPGSSVGQWLEKPRTTPKVGDRVGSRILAD